MKKTSKTKILFLSALACFGMMGATAINSSGLVETKAEDTIVKSTCATTNTKSGSFIDNNVEIATWKTDGNYGSSATQMRLNSGGTITFTASKNYILTGFGFGTNSTNTYLPNGTYSVDGGTAVSFTKPSSGTSFFVYTTTEAKQKIVVTISNSIRVTSFNISYKEAPNSPLTSIAISNQKTEYFQGDIVELPTVIATYEDQSTATVTGATLVNADTSTVGNHTATVSYTENEITKTCDYSYIVKEDICSGIAFKTLDVNGYLNQNWDLSNIVVEGTFTSGTKVVDASITTETPVPTSPGDYFVLVKANYLTFEISTSVNVTVKKEGLVRADAFTADEAIAFIDAGKGLDTKRYVIGTIKAYSWSSQFSNGEITLETSGDKVFKFYRFVFDCEKHDPKIGDTVIGYGELYKYQNTYELNAGCKVVDYYNSEHFVDTTNLVNLTLDKSGEIDFSSDVNLILTPSTGHVLPDEVTLKCGTTNFEDFTYNPFTGVITINAGALDDNGEILYIYGEADLQTFTITLIDDDHSSITSDYSESTIEYGSSYSATVSIDDGYLETICVKMGGENIEEDIYNAGVITIPFVTGDIEISVFTTKFELESISIEGEFQTTWYLTDGDDKFNFEGLTVSGLLTGGGSASIDQSKVNYSATKELEEYEIGENQEVTVKATYSGVTTSKTFTGISIFKEELTSFEITQLPAKTQYILGESFDSTGLVLTGTCNTGKTKTIEYSSIDSSAFNPLVEGTYSIVVKVDGLEDQTFDVTVSKKVLTPGETYFSVVKSETELVAGEKYVIASSANGAAAGELGSNAFMAYVDATIGDDGKLVSNSASVLTLGGEKGAWTLTNKEGTIGATAAKKLSVSGGTTTWTIEINTSTYEATIKNTNTSYGYFQCNSGNGVERFTTYTSYLGSVQLYKEVVLPGEQASAIAMTSATCNKTNLVEGSVVSSIDFTATMLFNDGTTALVTEDLTINGGTEVTLVGGNNTIVVSNGIYSCECVVNAKAATKATGIEVIASEEVVYGGETVECLAEVSPNDVDNDKVAWSSSNEDVATVDENGLVTTKVVSEDNIKVTITATTTDGTELSDSVELTINKDDVTEITIENLPTKTTYEDGDTFDGTGLTIIAGYESGNVEEVAYNGSNMTFDVTTLQKSVGSDKVIVEVTFEGCSTQFEITVNNKLSSVVVNGTIEGLDSLYSDMDSAKVNVPVLATYSDGDTLTDTVEVELDDLTAGTHTQSFTSFGRTIQFEYTVKAAEIVSISVSKLPTTTLYYEGENFDSTGMEINATFNSGKTKVLTSSEYTIVGGENLQGTTTSVEIKYTDSVKTNVSVEVETAADVQEIIVSSGYNSEVILNSSYEFNGTVIAKYASGNRDITSEVKNLIEEGIETNSIGEKTYEIDYYGKKALITVNVVYAPTTSLSINNKITETKNVGFETDLIATVNPNNANQDVTWSTSDNKVATIDEDGHLVTVGKGEVTITATSGNVSDSFTFNVVQQVTGITLDKTSLELEVNQEGKLTATINPGDANNKNIVWSSSDETKLLVSQDGTILGLEVGEYVVTVKTVDGEFTATCVVTIKEPANAEEEIQQNENNDSGCNGSLVGSSILVSLITLAGATLAISKRRKIEK